MAVTIFAMPSSALLLAFSVAFGGSNALPWAEPVQTKAYRADAWSPKPTGVPADPARLFKRASVGVQVCGWIGGDSSRAASCGVGSSCVHDTLHGYVGCCATSGPCTDGVYTSCVDEKNTALWSPTRGMINNGILTCQQSSACYRNTYPGGYFQHTCGDPSMATEVATSYDGQPRDMRLQLVFTGVNFSPMSVPASSASSTASAPEPSQSGEDSTEPAPAAAGKVTPASDTASSATSTSKPVESKDGIIAGSAVGAVAGLAILAAIVFCCLRRRQNKKNRVGTFTSGYQKGRPPTDTHFQRIRPYSPEDFANEYISPMTGPPHPDVTTTPNLAFAASRNYPTGSNHQSNPSDPFNPPSHRSAPSNAGSERDPFASPPSTGGFRDTNEDLIDTGDIGAYGAGGLRPGTHTPTEAHLYATATAMPITRTSPQAIQTRFPPPPREATREETPLVTEIDDFSRNWHDAITAQGYRMERERTLKEERSKNLLRSLSSLGGNGRTTNREAGSEALRGRVVIPENYGGESHWAATQMSRFGFAGPSTTHMAVGGDIDTSPPASPPPRSPLREEVMQAFNMATNRGNVTGKDNNDPYEPARQRADSGPRDKSPVRYQLVDEVATGGNVPILHSPGRAMRGVRPKKLE